MVQNRRETVDIGKLMKDKETTAVLAAGVTLEIAKATRKYMDTISGLCNQYKDVLSAIEFGMVLCITDGTCEGEGEDSIQSAQIIGHHKGLNKIRKLVDERVDEMIVECEAEEQEFND